MEHWLQIEISTKKQSQGSALLTNSDLPQDKSLLARQETDKTQQVIPASNLKFAATTEGFALVSADKLIPLQHGDVIEMPDYLAKLVITKLAKKHQSSHSLLAPSVIPEPVNQHRGCHDLQQKTGQHCLSFLDNKPLSDTAPSKQHLMPSAFQLPTYRPQTGFRASANDPNLGLTLNNNLHLGPNHYDDMEDKPTAQQTHSRSPLDDIERIFVQTLELDSPPNPITNTHKSNSLLAGLSQLCKTLIK